MGSFFQRKKNAAKRTAYVSFVDPKITWLNTVHPTKIPPMARMLCSIQLMKEEEDISIGQGYRYTLQDQDAFCLALGKAAHSYTTMGVGR